jgi:hypothetical protein
MRQGETRTVISTAFGLLPLSMKFRRAKLTFSASAAKRYLFSQPTQVRFINEDADDINFIAVNSSQLN